MKYSFDKQGWDRNEGHAPRQWNRDKGYNTQKKKHSGCRYGEKNGKPFVYGWKYDKRHGLRSFIAGEYVGEKSETKTVTSKSGREWRTWRVKITHSDGTVIWKNCLHDEASKRVFINDMYMMMSPKARNGGYVGPISRKN